MDQNVGKQCDQDFTVTSLVNIDESELMAFKNAQQAYPILKELLALPKVELKHRNFEISPQGILANLEDDKQRVVVAKEMR